MGRRTVQGRREWDRIRALYKGEGMPDRQARRARWRWGETTAGRAKGLAALDDGITKTYSGIAIEGLQGKVEPEPSQSHEPKAMDHP